MREKGIGDKFIIDSCGTAGYHVGEPPDYRSIDTCKKHQVPVNHVCRRLADSDFSKFEYILCMDHSNLSDIMSRRPKSCAAVIKLFGEYDSENPENPVIQDPYYGGIDGFETNFQQCVRSSQGLLRSLKL